MKIIITGASGFIGSRLVEVARKTYGDGNVIGFSSSAAKGNIVYNDEAGFGLGEAALACVEGADVLIHAGAFTPKCGAEANQIAACTSNITFTEKLFEVNWKNLKKIIYLSSIDVYSNGSGSIDEMTATLPNSLYGLSKLYAERMVTLYASNRGINSLVLRIGHVYGPGEEKYAKVIPKTIQNIQAGKDVELWGEGEELRSFIYIDDVVTAILNGVKLQEDPGVINVVSGYQISIKELLKMIVGISGRNVTIRKRKFSGVPRDFIFNNAKIKRYLLANETNFAIGLREEYKHMANLHNNTL